MKGDDAYLDDEEMELDVEQPPVVADDHDSRKRAEQERSRRSYKVRKGIEDFFEQRRIRNLLGDDEY
ncbi:MAG: hypothetical protein II007_15475 [Gammaproteobacteria bacterium]|nr:hypothetical protein [Gammaproteobacteria bacterium]